MWTTYVDIDLLGWSMVGPRKLDDGYSFERGYLALWLLYRCRERVPYG